MRDGSPVGGTCDFQFSLWDEESDGIQISCLTFYALLLVALLALSAVLARGARAGPAPTEAGSGYDLSWWTVDSGGATFSTGDGCSLGGTVGQPDAGVLVGGDYTLAGGFWGGGAVYHIYLPLVMRQSP